MASGRNRENVMLNAHKFYRARHTFGAVALALTFTATATFAQTPPMRIRGQIEKVDGSMLTIKARDGNTMMVKLADNARITAMVKSSVADIKPGSFIGVTAMPQADGSQKAIGLHIFMDAQRGVVPEGFRPWDREPGSTMTNANVDSKVASVNGDTIVVKYKDGEKKVIVPPGTPVVAFTPGSKDDLKPGAMMIIMGAQKKAAGRFAYGASNQCRPRWRRSTNVIAAQIGRQHQSYHLRLINSWRADAATSGTGCCRYHSATLMVARRIGGANL
jgi:outer membrane lipoprotein SlyB